MPGHSGGSGDEMTIQFLQDELNRVHKLELMLNAMIQAKSEPPSISSIQRPESSRGNLFNYGTIQTERDIPLRPESTKLSTPRPEGGPMITSTFACNQSQVDPDQSYKVVSEALSCVDFAKKFKIDRDFFFPPFDGKPLCKHYKDVGLCSDKNASDMCPSTCSNGPVGPKRKPRQGEGIDVPCFPVLTDASYTSRSKYLRSVMPLFIYQDDFDYTQIADNDIQPYLVNSSSNRDSIHPMWVNNPRVFIAWNGLVAIVTPRPQLPQTKMTVNEVKSMISCMNYMSLMTLVYMMAIQPKYVQTVMRAKGGYCMIKHPIGVVFEKDVKPLPNSFMSEWIVSKTIVEYAIAFGINLKWDVQEVMSFTDPRPRDIADTTTRAIKLSWADCVEFWGSRTSSYADSYMDAIKSAAQNPNSKNLTTGEIKYDVLAKDMQYFTRPLKGQTTTGILAGGILTNDDSPWTCGPPGMLFGTNQIIDTAAMAMGYPVFHEFSHSIDFFHDRKFTTGEYQSIFNTLTKETSGYLSGERWMSQEHFAEMGSRIVSHMFYDILMESAIAMQALFCNTNYGNEVGQTSVFKEMKLPLESINPEWRRPAEYIMQNLMIQIHS